MRYEIRYRNGHANSKVSAVTVYEYIEMLKKRNGGHLDPKQIVDDARRANSPLHDCFEWDDKVAADQHRINQARQLMTSIEKIEFDDENTEIGRSTPVYVSVATPWEKGRSYMDIKDAMEDPVIRESVVKTARMQLEGWVLRHRHLEELAELRREVEVALERTKADKRAARSRKAKQKVGKRVPAVTAR